MGNEPSNSRVANESVKEEEEPVVLEPSDIRVLIYQKSRSGGESSMLFDSSPRSIDIRFYQELIFGVMPMHVQGFVLVYSYLVNSLQLI